MIENNRKTTVCVFIAQTLKLVVYNCATFPENIRIVEALSENLVLQIWDRLELSEEGVIHLFFLIGWSVTDVCHEIDLDDDPSDSDPRYSTYLSPITNLRVFKWVFKIKYQQWSDT